VAILAEVGTRQGRRAVQGGLRVRAWPVPAFTLFMLKIFLYFIKLHLKLILN
jgi:hypothetical protein